MASAIASRRETLSHPSGGAMYAEFHVPKSRIANVNLFVDPYVRQNLPLQPAFGVFQGL